MSCKQMVKKIKHILLGTYYNLFHKKQEVAYPRLKICAQCEHNKVLFRFGNYCNICGCLLKSKTTVLDEKCPMNKW